MKKIHSKIKETLGFNPDISDKEFKKEWKRMTSQVCKPCWELKYCPYGPFVEQSPLLPSTKNESIEHFEYLKNCLKTGIYGTVNKVGNEELEFYKSILKDAEDNIIVLLPRVLNDLDNAEMFKNAEKNNLELQELLKAPSEKFETYDVPFPLDKGKEKELMQRMMETEITDEIKLLLKKDLEFIKKIVNTGIRDDRKKLEPIRRKYFNEIIDKSDIDNCPDYIPRYISEMSCSIFGHICPVVFVGEAITETTEERRRSRYISFKTKIRVVRRDNYTCQECNKHLQDDEVEFDHIIPFAKGGSSEEHNIRLTCFDCNRSKSDKTKL